MRRLLILPLLLGVSLPVQAGVDPEVHKLCKDVKDYMGCVKAQSQDSDKAGNSCPDGYAYFGEGYCREVTCVNYSLVGEPHDTLLGGRKWKCTGPAAGFTLSFGQALRIGNNPDCPTGVPEKGWGSTCDAPYKEPPKEERVAGRPMRSSRGGGSYGGTTVNNNSYSYSAPPANNSFRHSGPTTSNIPGISSQFSRPYGGPSNPYGGY